MTRPSHSETALQPSPLQSLIQEQQLRREQQSDSQTPPAHLPSLHALATQIEHNLVHQHYWSDLTHHTHSPLNNAPLPRPLLSGVPPQRLYTHPDEQIELLKDADRARKARSEGEEGGLEVKAEPEREWILPTRLSEKWTLRRLAEVFDGISLMPPEPEAGEQEQHGKKDNEWRKTKRIVLATVDTDSTVVYYIVQDGVVKPRQN
jgi:tRNA-splicing endonuclease subunit Sen15